MPASASEVLVGQRYLERGFLDAAMKLFIRNADKPGFIGRFGMLMGDAGLNIATLNLGRDRPGGDAICMVAVDEPVSDEVLARIRALPQVVRVNRLEF